MSKEELLSQLRDIQGPAEPPWWLLAPIQLWLAAAVVMVAMVAWFLLRRRQGGQIGRLAANELQAIQREYRADRDQRQLALRLSCWLRQVALLAYPARQLHGISGDAWLEFLDQGLPQQPFSRGCGQVFGGEVYRQQVELDAEQVLSLCERWLTQLEPRLRRDGRG